MRQTIFHPYVTLAANEHIVKDYRKNYIKSINVPKTIHEHNLRNPQNFAKINPAPRHAGWELLPTFALRPARSSV